MTILEKIRAEIEQFADAHCSGDDINIYDVFQIIDKYAEQEPIYNKLSFPSTFDEFVEQYGITDTDEVYTNGSKLIPAFRVKQWLAEQEPKWIPVSERLPEKTGIYLISIGDLVTSKSFDGHDFRTESAVRFIPDAWMPLPKPYEQQERSEQE